MSPRVRLDRYLVDHALAPSRERAQALILAGKVRVNGRPATKAGQSVPADATVEVIGADHPFASRGGVKLAHALAHFQIDVAGWICLDAGASTGGFVDCLLQRGAARVYAVDVGRGQLAWGLQQDPRVLVRDKTNLRRISASGAPGAASSASGRMTPDNFPELMDGITLDLSFISLTNVFPAVDRLLKPGGQVVALIKPQFEVGKGRVGKGGIVRDPALHEESIAKVRAAAIALGWSDRGVVSSPITGAEGNVEFLAHFVKQR